MQDTWLIDTLEEIRRDMTAIEYGHWKMMMRDCIITAILCAVIGAGAGFAVGWLAHP